MRRRKKNHLAKKREEGKTMLTDKKPSMYDHGGYFYFFDVINYYKRIYKDFDMLFHSHEYVEIMYINFGEMDIEYAENEGEKTKVVTVSTGEYAVIDGGIVHKITVREKETQILNVELQYSPPVPPLCLSVKTLIENDKNFKAFFSDRERFFILTDHSNVGRHLIMLIEYLKSIERGVLESYRSPYVDFSIAALLSQVADNYVQQNELHSFTGIKYLRKATKYISENYSHPISVEKIAEQAGVSQNYLNKLFSDEYAMTVNEYLNHYKIFKAKMLLEKTDIPIAQVAAQVGYNNKQSFNKNFFRFVEMSPRAYKKFINQKNDIHWTE